MLQPGSRPPQLLQLIRLIEVTPRSPWDVEAESAAMFRLCLHRRSWVEYSRAYIQHWIAGETIAEKSAQKILHVADQILKADSSPGRFFVALANDAR